MGNKLNNISDELLASYLDGNTSLNETQQVLDALACDARLQEFMQISHDIDIEIDNNKPCVLPMTEMAASNSIDNLCNILCERYALLCLGIFTKVERLTTMAARKGWLRENGTPLHHIGRISESFGLATSRQYDSSLATINECINSGKQVLAVVNKAILHGKDTEDPSPDHVIHIGLVYDSQIKIFEPDSHSINLFSTDQFIKAWQASHNYIVVIYDDPYSYEPHPIDVSDIELEYELIDLQEAIAENAHEEWAENRRKEGWTYGPERDDEKKEHPDMMPYGCLPESEKEYDRIMAMNTLKLVKKLGYDIIKRKE